MMTRFGFLLYSCRIVVLGLLLLAHVGASFASPTPRATVYIFLSDTCPICQTATLTLRQLHTTYSPQGIAFIGVFPDAQTRPADIILFQKQFQLPFPLRQDEGQLLTHRFSARITPEVVVVGATGTILYQGRIDDSYVALGKRRVIIAHHELQDALAAITKGQSVAVPRTEAVGCFIN